MNEKYDLRILRLDDQNINHVCKNTKINLWVSYVTYHRVKSKFTDQSEFENNHHHLKENLLVAKIIAKLTLDQIRKGIKTYIYSRVIWIG